jgi:hypothetical protein
LPPPTARASTSCPPPRAELPPRRAGSRLWSDRRTSTRFPVLPPSQHPPPGAPSPGGEPLARLTRW